MDHFRYFIWLFFLLGNLSSASQDYFQQEVNYKINATLNDKNHSISAKETIEYVNNSPDVLGFIWFHLWPNAYKNGETALAKQMMIWGDNSLKTAAKDDRGWIDSIDFTINGKHLKWEYHPEYIDICKVYLDKPLLPGEKIYIQTPFYVKIPSSDFSRFGHYEQSYQISQWYPKPAVYDRFGWHPMPYLDMGEFYSEFGSFDVTLTLPENYVVGATGELYTESELQFLDKKSRETQKILQYDSLAVDFPVSSKKLKTIRYTEKNIHDFAWFADKRYHVLKSEVILPHSKRPVTTFAMFTNQEAYLWKNASEYINDAIYYYSLWIGDYPYKYCSAVQAMEGAGGGMEYPNITLIGPAGSDKSLEEVIMHEVGHNWWYGILGSNERDFPWIDEGINTFYQLRYMKTKYPDYNGSDYLGFGKGISELLQIKDLPYQGFYDIANNIFARANNDQPLNLSSEEYNSANYFTGIYLKTAFNFYYLMSYLGEEDFDKTMKAFFEKWKFRHPGPDDIENVFKDSVPGKSDFLFGDLIETTKRVDYKISRLKKCKSGEIKITLKNTGDVASPVSLSLLREGKEVSSMWVEGFSGKKDILLSCTDFDHARIDNNQSMPELNRKNNTIRKTGYLKKMEPLKFSFLTTIESHNYTNFYYFPLLGYNYYDKFMPGLAIYNLSVQQKKLEYVFAPMYSFERNNISGTGILAFNFQPFRDIFKSANIKITGSTYGLSSDYSFKKIKSEINLVLKNKKMPAPVTNTITLSAVSATNLIDLIYFDKSNLSNYYLLKFSHLNKRKFYPFRYNFNLEAGEDYAKSYAEAAYKINYNKRRKSFDLRLFAGAFLYSGDGIHNNNFRLSGWNGSSDYMYEHVYPGRIEFPNMDGHNHLLSQQFIMADGGFAINSPIGSTNRWLAACNFSAALPFELPLKIYGGMGMYSQNVTEINNGSIRNFTETKTAAELGVEFVIIRNFCSVYFPVTLSKEINNYFETNGFYYWQKIRFTLNLAVINPVKLVKEIEF